jgi:hypothetical protein
MTLTKMEKAQQHSRTLHKITLSVTLTLALGSLGMVAESAQALQSQSTKSSSLSNGTFLYGETPQPNQIRKGYVVFQHQNGKVVGATYTPRSEFDCFAGYLKNTALDVETIRSDGSRATGPDIELSALHSMQRPSSNDQRILETCKQETAQLARAGKLPQELAFLP